PQHHHPGPRSRLNVYVGAKSRRESGHLAAEFQCPLLAQSGRCAFAHACPWPIHVSSSSRQQSKHFLNQTCPPSIDVLHVKILIPDGMAPADLASHSFKGLQAQQYGEEVVRFCSIHGGDTPPSLSI